MSDSILTSTKKLLSIDEADTSFDLDIILHINSVFSMLTQLGIGPKDGYMIEDAAATWADFLGPNKTYSMAKSYVYLRVKMLFDPVSTRYSIAAISDTVRELEVRLNIEREANEWVEPLQPVDRYAYFPIPLGDGYDNTNINEIVFADTPCEFPDEIPVTEHTGGYLDYDDEPSFTIGYENGKV